MTTFHPPPDESRCRAIVLIGGQRGRCRKKRRWPGAELCWKHQRLEIREGKLPRVPEPKHISEHRSCGRDDCPVCGGIEMVPESDS